LDLGADRIDAAERIGGPRTSRGLRRIASQDADFVTVELM
jgi:hypothetical protein